MPSNDFTKSAVYDFLGSFDGGANSGVAPLKLPKQQVGFATNLTFRGEYPRPRPAYRKIALDFGGDAALQSAFQSGLFQGGCYYAPDFGNSALMVALSGRLFQCSIAGTTATISEKTIPGDPNPSTITQAWLWQAENYVIWNDGQSLPVFYDGNTSRRSYGPKKLLATTALNFTAPAIGSTVTVTLAAAYTGPLNVPVLIGSAFYQTVSSGTGDYQVSLTNLYDIPGTVVPTGTQVISNPNILGVQATTVTFPTAGTTYTAGTLSVTLTLTEAPNGVVGNRLILFGKLFQITAIGGPGNKSVLVKNLQSVTVPPNLPAGTIIYLSPGGSAVTIVGTTTAPYTVPAIGNTVVVSLTTPYTGPAGGTIYVNNGQYQITAVPPPAPGTALVLINLSDTLGNVVTQPANIYSVPEVPAGRMGAYGMGRNWESLPDGKQLVASDLVGGPSGTQANNFRDAVLKITENDFLVGGGNFTVPGGDIRALVFTAILDASLGQGPLQIHTPRRVFSAMTPVDRTTWQTLTNPILPEVLIGSGGLGQNSTTLANGDTFFRSLVGLGTVIFGRREFDTWGNVPISREVDRVLSLDEQSLLPFGTAIVFNNRFLVGCVPTASPQGVYHQGLIALNFDPISTIRGKAPSIYDGLWTGLNVLQLFTGQFNSVDRAFAVCFNPDLNKIEIWEVLNDSDVIKDDDNTNPITCSFEGPVLFNQAEKTTKQLLRLLNGEIYIDELLRRVDFNVSYKVEQYPCWTPWFSWSHCANPDSNGKAIGYKPRMGLGEPSPKDCDTFAGRPMREGYNFQVRVQWTGFCRFLGARFMAIPVPEPTFAPPLCDPLC